ncbi:MAG TPA: ABC transporter permease [Candidatus Pelethocola excrementipullorum]|nr:ABC transporter permease [Candidatus Pelethocola excrementipullorum]
MKERMKRGLTTNEMIVVYIIFALCVLIGVVNPAFAGVSTVVTLLRSMLVTLIFAAFEMLVIISGGIDVSFPAVASFSMYATAMIMNASGLDHVVIAFLIAIVIGMMFGALNSVLIVRFKIPPLIATLGVSSVANGATLSFLGSKEINRLPESFGKLSRVFIYEYAGETGITYQLTVLILIPMIICIGIWILLKFTMLGRGIYAVGGDKNAARVAGFRVTFIQSFVYVLAGGLAGVGGVTYMILMRQAHPQVLMGTEMMVIAAVVMGGTRITGGHGTILGTILGVTLIALIQNNLIMLGIPTYGQTFVVGLLIVIGTSITSLRTKRIQNSIKI